MRGDSAGFHGNGETVLSVEILEGMQILLVGGLHLVRARGGAGVRKAHAHVDRAPFHLIRDSIVATHALNEPEQSIQIQVAIRHHRLHVNRRTVFVHEFVQLCHES